MPNNIDLVNTLGVMNNRHSINLVNNIDSDKESFFVYYIDNESDDNRNRIKEDDSKNLRLERYNYR